MACQYWNLWRVVLLLADYSVPEGRSATCISTLLWACRYAESMEKPTADKEVESGTAEDQSHAVQDKACKASPVARQSMHKEAAAPGRAPKRLADWSESDED